MTTEQKIKQLDLEIELLKKEKEKALIQQEIEKIKKTKIEEITIERRRIIEPCNPDPLYPCPTYPNQPWITWYNKDNEVVVS